MGKKIIVNEKQFARLFSLFAAKKLNVEGMVLVRHMKNSHTMDKDGGFSSPSEYWKSKTEQPIVPVDYICTSCMKKKRDDQFVVGHIENMNGEGFLYPVCDECNKTYKGKKAGYLFYAYKDRLLPLPPTD